MSLLRDEVLDRVMLRRTKAECQSILSIVPCRSRTHKVSLTSQERNFYDTILHKTQVALSDENCRGSFKRSYIFFYTLVLRLRLAVDHPYLVTYGMDYKIGRGESHSRRLLDRVGSCLVSSSKIEALVSELEDLKPDDKCLVFSQFTRMLELVSARLRSVGILTMTLEGCQTICQRADIIASFNSTSHCQVLLVSLMAGGEGLNLQAANKVFILDPWWNPAVELQAISRVHRIGQKRPVEVVRFVTVDSIEEKILLLQQQKQQLFDYTIGYHKGRLTQGDFKFLLGS